jgi:site-specific recombinase XerD
MLAASDLNDELIARYKLWLSALDYSVPTQRRYPRIVREFCESAGTKAVIRTTPWDVRKFLMQETRRGLRYSTVHDLLVVLRNFSEFLGLGGMRGRIPVQTIQMRAAPRNPPNVVSPRTIFRLIAAARNPRDVTLLELLYLNNALRQASVRP